MLMFNSLTICFKNKTKHNTRHRDIMYLPNRCLVNFPSNLQVKHSYCCFSSPPLTDLARRRVFTSVEW